MAPVASLLTLALAAAGVVDAKPLLTPGRHAKPELAGILSSAKRSLFGLHARYYGAAHGLHRPPPLPEKRSNIPGGWTYHGCISESYEERLLQGFSFYSPSLTPLLCMTECAKLGYDIAGMEYGDECYCGNDYAGNGGAPNPDSHCNIPCGGDDSQMCGNAWVLSLYTYNMTGLPACTPGEAVTTTIIAPSATASVSASASDSVSASVSASDAYSSASASVSASLTAVPSAVVTSETVVISGSTTVVPSTISVAPSTTVSSAEPAKTSIYTDGKDASQWYALGCATDAEPRTLLDHHVYNIEDLTIDSCLSLCEDLGYGFAGVEYGEECHCGKTISSAITFHDDSVCSMPCTGDASETCGGDWALELFELIGNATNCSSTAVPTSTSIIASVSQSSAVSISDSASLSASVTTSVAVSASVTASISASASESASASATASTTVVTPSTPPTAPPSDATHAVWAHHMVGNTYPYTQRDWQADIQGASDAAIDGFALNIGVEQWQFDRLHDAYAAAQSLGDFKMFLSLDMTSLGCSSSWDAQRLINVVQQYASHPNQAMHKGKVLVSTFAGSDCTFGVGSQGWQSAFVDPLKAAGVDIFFVPSIFSDVSTFSANTWMDGELNWNSAWPPSSGSISTDTDVTYMNALGDKEYMPAVSPYFFTHFGANSWNKNWLYRSDDWLYCTRWEQIIEMRDKVYQTEILTWNDFGESSYIGPIAGALPAGSNAWVDGHDHESINYLTKYYATAFKTGSYPAITEDKVIVWTRPHAADATASNDHVGRPTGWDWTHDYLYAVVFAAEPSTVTLTSGSNTETFSVAVGLHKLKVASSEGGVSASISRGGSTVAQYQSTDFQWTRNPTAYNYNYFMGSS